MRTTPLLVTLSWILVAACAAPGDDAEPITPDPADIEVAAPARCDAQDLEPCIEDDDLAQCTQIAIKHEYEMLDAEHRGDAPGFACHRAVLVALLEHACDLGDDPSCAQQGRVASAPAPTGPRGGETR